MEKAPRFDVCSACRGKVLPPKPFDRAEGVAPSSDGNEWEVAGRRKHRKRSGPSRWEAAQAAQKLAAEVWQKERLQTKKYNAAVKIQSVLRGRQVRMAARDDQKVEDNVQLAKENPRSQMETVKSNAVSACDDALLDVAIAQTDSERQEWLQKRDAADALLPAQERSVALICPAGHYLRTTKPKGKCASCKKKITKNSQAVGCDGDCNQSFCMACAKSVCGDDVETRLKLAWSSSQCELDNG